MEEFKPGETVQLKSGGPIMTVKQVAETQFEGIGVWCVWFEKVGSRQEAKERVFAPVTLKNPVPAWQACRCLAAET